MGHALRPGLHFCCVGNQPIFLDVPEDRYFCLGGEADTAFRRLIATGECDPPAATVLIDAGILLAHDGTRAPTAAQRLPVPIDTLLDRKDRPGAVPTARALGDIAGAYLHLRYRGFASLLAAFERRKRGTKPRRRDEQRLRSALSGFTATRYLVAEHDRCLVRSFAIGTRLLRLGLAPDVVIGVKLQPFKAHCWVQLDAVLVNDRPDIVREFTPILIL